MQNFMYIQLKLNFSQNIILYNFTIWNNYSRSDLPCRQSFLILSQSELRLPLLQVVSSNKYFSVGVQSPTEINAPRGCAVILKRRCQLALTRITHQVSRAFDLNFCILPEIIERFWNFMDKMILYMNVI